MIKNRILMMIVSLFLIWSGFSSIANSSEKISWNETGRRVDNPTTYGDLFILTFDGSMSGTALGERPKVFGGISKINTTGSAKLIIKPTWVTKDSLRMVLFIEDASYYDKNAQGKMPSSFTIPVILGESIVNSKIDELKKIELRDSYNDDTDKYVYYFAFTVTKEGETFKMKGELRYSQVTLPGGIYRKDEINFGFEGNFSKPDYLE